MAARRISKSSSVGEELDEIEFEVCSAAVVADLPSALPAKQPSSLRRAPPALETRDLVAAETNEISSPRAAPSPKAWRRSPQLAAAPAARRPPSPPRPPGAPPTNAGHKIFGALSGDAALTVFLRCFSARDWRSLGNFGLSAFGFRSFTSFAVGMRERLELCQEMERNIRSRAAREGHASSPLLELVEPEHARGWLTIVGEVPEDKLIKCVALVIARIISAARDATEAAAPILSKTADAVRQRLFCEPLTAPVPGEPWPREPASPTSTVADDDGGGDDPGDDDDDDRGLAVLEARHSMPADELRATGAEGQFQSGTWAGDRRNFKLLYTLIRKNLEVLSYTTRVTSHGLMLAVVILDRFLSKMRGTIELDLSNVRPLLAAAMILAVKVLRDNRANVNGELAATCAGVLGVSAKVVLERINAIELAMLDAINWDTQAPRSIVDEFGPGDTNAINMWVMAAAIKGDVADAELAKLCPNHVALLEHVDHAEDLSLLETEVKQPQLPFAIRNELLLTFGHKSQQLSAVIELSSGDPGGDPPSRSRSASPPPPSGSRPGSPSATDPNVHLQKVIAAYDNYSPAWARRITHELAKRVNLAPDPVASGDGRLWRAGCVSKWEREEKGTGMANLVGRLLHIKDLGVCTVVKHNKTNPLKPNLPQTPEQLLSPYAYTPSAVYPPSTHTVRCRDGTCHDIVLQRVKLGELIGCPYRILDDADPAPPADARPEVAGLARADSRR